MHLNVIINGRVEQLDGNPSAEHEISYEDICTEAGKNPAHNPTVTYSIPGGRDGCITSGGKAPLVDGAIYTVMVTGDA